MNPHLERLQPYPFERWRAYIGHTRGPETLPPISLAIGEPRHPTPSFLQQALGEHAAGMAHYPQTAGRPSLRTHIADWLARRYQIPALDPDHQVLPTLGSREALFAITQVLLDPCAQEYVICPNPFYQIYEGATLLAGGHPYFLNAQPAHQDRFDYTDIPTEILSRTRLIFLCSPNNPTGQILTLEDWQQLFQLSDRYGLTLVSDECYSEIYPDEEHPHSGHWRPPTNSGDTVTLACWSWEACPNVRTYPVYAPVMSPGMPPCYTLLPATALTTEVP